jgi:hypothetical protein
MFGLLTAQDFELLKSPLFNKIAFLKLFLASSNKEGLLQNESRTRSVITAFLKTGNKRQNIWTPDASAIVKMYIKNHFYDYLDHHTLTKYVIKLCFNIV